jgi:hypothetical protein
MANVIESPVFAVTRAGATLPVSGAFLPVPDRGRTACARITGTGLSAIKGTGMPSLSPAHVQDQILGQTPTRKPYTDKTRVAAIGGGARGPHPAREPEPV